MLEIGVQSGGSSRIWSQYFGKRLNYTGFDINPTEHVLNLNLRLEIFILLPVPNLKWKMLAKFVKILGHLISL